MQLAAPADAPALVAAIAAVDGGGLLLVDPLPDPAAADDWAAWHSTLARLRPPMTRTGWLVVLLARDTAGPTLSQAEVRLHVERTRWLRQGRWLTGYQARVTIERQRGQSPAAPVPMTIDLAGAWP